MITDLSKEELREEVARLQTKNAALVLAWDEMERRANRHHDIQQRYEAALREIAGFEECEFYGDDCPADAMHRIAREALAAAQEGARDD